MLFLYLYYSLCDFNDNQIKGKTIMRQFDEGEKEGGRGKEREGGKRGINMKPNTISKGVTLWSGETGRLVGLECPALRVCSVNRDRR